MRAVPDEDSVFWNRDKGRYLSRYNFVGNYISGKKVLDIACGAGYGSDLLAAKRVKNVDPDQAYLDIKGAWQLKPSELAILKPLATWRPPRAPWYHNTWGDSSPWDPLYPRG